jgi:hypothetical protein
MGRPDRGLEGTDGSKGKKITEGCCFVSSNSKKRRESTGAPREVISSFPEKEQKCFAVQSWDTMDFFGFGCAWWGHVWSSHAMIRYIILLTLSRQ